MQSGRGDAAVLVGMMLVAAAVPVRPRAQSPAPGAPGPGVSRPAGPLQNPGPPAPPKAGTGTIRGLVTAADTGVPLRRVQLHLLAEGATGPGTLTGTDDQGRYEYTTLPAGRYTISAAKSGYVSLSYGQRRPLDAARPIQIGDGQMLDRLDLALPRGGSMAVRVTDDLGEPFAGARVQLEQYRFTRGQRQLTAPFSAESDDEGAARFSQLPPGDYYVSATPTPDRVVGLGATDGARILAPTYHPGATSVADATRVSVAVGQEQSVAVQLAAVRTARVRGTIRSVTGEPLAGTLRLMPMPAVASQLGPIARIEADGGFTFSNVMPGHYAIRINNGGGQPLSAPRLYVDMLLDVAGDLDNVAVTATAGGTVRGRILFDTGTPPPNIRLDTMAIAADPSWATVLSPGQFRANEDGTFELSGIVGRSVLRPRILGSMNGWFLKSVVLDGKDITDAVVDFSTAALVNVEVTLTQKQSTLSVSVVDGRNAAATEAVVVLFPDNSQMWTPQSRMIAAIRPDQQGRFSVSGLPRGSYFAAAIATLESGEERDVDLLRRLQDRAIRFALAENEVKAITVPLMP